MENDAISRSALREQIRLMAKQSSLGGTRPAYISGIEVCRLISNAPALDVVPVVRCGDCRWYDSAFYVCSKCGVCVNRDFFCADGEKEG